MYNSYIKIHIISNFKKMFNLFLFYHHKYKINYYIPTIIISKNILIMLELHITNAIFYNVKFQLLDI